MKVRYSTAIRCGLPCPRSPISTRGRPCPAPTVSIAARASADGQVISRKSAAAIWVAPVLLALVNSIAVPLSRRPRNSLPASVEALDHSPQEPASSLVGGRLPVIAGRSYPNRRIARQRPRSRSLTTVSLQSR